MSNALRSVAIVCWLLGIVTSSSAADALNGKNIAKRWCASCHLVERG